MSLLSLALISLHITANLIWVGSIIAVGIIVARAAWAPSEPIRRITGGLALSIYRSVATPAFIVSFLSGATRIALSPTEYAHMHWFHAKLAIAIVVIGLHHVIGAQARKTSLGATRSPTSTSILTAILAVCALGISILVVFRTALVP